MSPKIIKKLVKIKKFSDRGVFFPCYAEIVLCHIC